MSEERDTRIEHLEVGDRLRYLRRWFTIEEARGVPSREWDCMTAVFTGTFDDEQEIDPRTDKPRRRHLIFRFGVFVAVELGEVA